MGDIYCVKRKIEGIIKGSQVPEDPIHSKNTLECLLKLKADADNALKIAAWGHDIERAMEERKVKRKDYRSYDEFKDAHALNSARVLAEIMEECEMPGDLVDDVFFLVRHHERGGTGRANLLKAADTISFFHVNLPYYFMREGEEETKRRCMWGLRRLPGNLKKVVVGFDYQNQEIAAIVKSCTDPHPTNYLSTKAPP